MNGTRPRIFILSITLLAAVAHPAIAQAQGIDHRVPQVIIGVTLAEVTFKQAGLGVDWSAGFAGGVDFTLPQPKNHIFSVHPEALFVQKGAHVTSTVDEHIRANYLEGVIDLQFKALANQTRDRITLEIAPTVSVLLNASNDVNGQHVSLTESVNRIDAGVMVGGMVHVAPRLDVGVRFEQSFINFFKDSTDDARNRSLLIFVTPHIIKD